MARKKQEVAKEEVIVKKATISDFDVIIEPLITEKAQLNHKKETKLLSLLKVMLIKLKLKTLSTEFITLM